MSVTDAPIHATPTHRTMHGSAYDMRPGAADHDLTSVDRGTPGGEMLRRYWHPVAVAADVGDLPLAVRALGEDMVLFRTPAGTFGLVHPRCAHRGTSLMYGRVEAQGIRCCYHGWLFDAQGVCLEQPCEPDNGGARREKVRQPWYPVEERYGLVFAYMGPLDLKPALPRYDVLEGLDDHEHIQADGNSIGSGGPTMMPCNWVQTHENVMDSWHVFVLHTTFSVSQFNENMAIRPDISWGYTGAGTNAIQVRALPDGATLRRVVEIVMPNIRIVPDPRLGVSGPANTVAWTLPIDTTNTKIFTVFRNPKTAPAPNQRKIAMYAGKTWFELSEEEHQRLPGDYEAQVSQGPVTLHSEEHLVSSDRGIGMYRRLFREAIKDVQHGKDPLNIVREGDHLHVVQAGNFVSRATTV